MDDNDSDYVKDFSIAAMGARFERVEEHREEGREADEGEAAYLRAVDDLPPCVMGEFCELDSDVECFNKSHRKRKGKEYCERCSCMVNPAGHEDRCVPVVYRASYSDGVLYVSWLGNARHEFDVKCAIVLAGVAVADREIRLQKYIALSVRAGYYSSCACVKFPAKGTSDKSIAVAFGASYFGEFRRNYRVWLREVLPPKVLLREAEVNVLLKSFFDDPGDG